MYKFVYIFIHHFLFLMNLNLVVNKYLDCYCIPRPHLLFTLLYGGDEATSNSEL